MEITKEAIQARADSLQKQAEKLRGDLNAVIGALQDCGYWLAQLDQPSTEPPKETP
jgi:hypothetical protein